MMKINLSGDREGDTPERARNVEPEAKITAPYDPMAGEPGMKDDGMEEQMMVSGPDPDDELVEDPDFDTGTEDGEEREPLPSESIASGGEEPPVTIVKKKKGLSSGGQKAVLVVILIALVAVFAWKKKDMLLGLFQSESEPVEVAAPPPPPPKPPVEEVREPDPVFVVLNRIGETVPPRVWLTRAVLSCDGGYEITGMAFAHGPMSEMAESLGSAGELTGQSIPDRSKSAETVYRFGMSGTIAGITAPEILDPVPPDELTALAASVSEAAESLGVTFSRLPKEGETPGEDDLPFRLTGPYDGLRQIVSILCPEGGTTRVYRMVIEPSTPGRTFDHVVASFALRKTSSI